jgi:hypothetical protein
VPMKGRFVLVAAAAVTLSAGALAPAAARADDSVPAYRLSVDVDVPVLLLGVASASSYFLMNETGPAACAPRCDPARLNRFDRPFAGLYSTSWQKVGDLATVSTLLLAPVAVLAGEGVPGGLSDVVVVAEAALVTSAVQVPISYAVARPRPRLYGDKAPLDERDDSNGARSFFSGHVANCVAATIAASQALRRVHHPRLAWTALLVGLTG